MASGRDLVCEWLFEYGCRHYMPIVLNEIATHHASIWTEDLWSVPPVFPLMAAVHDILHSGKEENYASVVNVLAELYELTSGLVQYKLYAKLVVAVKILVLFRMLRSSDHMVIPRLNTYFPRAGFHHTNADQKTEVQLNHAQTQFRKFFLQLVASERMRQAYLENGFEEDYGEEFVTRLKELLQRFLHAIETALPKSVIDMLLESSPDSAIIKELISSNSPAILMLLDAMQGRDCITEGQALEILQCLRRNDSLTRVEHPSGLGIDIFSSPVESVPSGLTILRNTNHSPEASATTNRGTKRKAACQGASEFESRTENSKDVQRGDFRELNAVASDNELHSQRSKRRVLETRRTTTKDSSPYRAQKQPLMEDASEDHQKTTKKLPLVAVASEDRQNTGSSLAALVRPPLSSVAAQCDRSCRGENGLEESERSPDRLRCPKAKKSVSGSRISSKTYLVEDAHDRRSRKTDDDASVKSKYFDVEAAGSPMLSRPAISRVRVGDVIEHHGSLDGKTSTGATLSSKISAGAMLTSKTSTGATLSSEIRSGATLTSKTSTGATLTGNEAHLGNSGNCRQPKSRDGVHSESLEFSDSAVLIATDHSQINVARSNNGRNSISTSRDDSSNTQFLNSGDLEEALSQRTSEAQHKKCERSEKAGVRRNEKRVRGHSDDASTKESDEQLNGSFCSCSLDVEEVDVLVSPLVEDMIPDTPELEPRATQCPALTSRRYRSTDEHSYVTDSEDLDSYESTHSQIVASSYSFDKFDLVVQEGLPIVSVPSLGKLLRPKLRLCLVKLHWNPDIDYTTSRRKKLKIYN